jgi:hypothetical protein
VATNASAEISVGTKCFINHVLIVVN